MRVVEQHCIGKSDTRYPVIDSAAFASKNLYNAALYDVRQSYIHTGVYLPYATLYHRMKGSDAYKALPAKVAQQVLRLLDKNWKAYFVACRAWEEDPSKFLSHPCLPKYKDKQKGRNILVYTIQALSATALKRGMIAPSGLPIEIPTHARDVAQVRIIPRNGHYVVEVVYERAPIQANVNPALYASIDIGLNNLAALTSNKSGFVPRIVNGRPVKSINQWYNKERARLQSILIREKRYTSNHLERLTNKRTRKIDHYLHAASRTITDLLVSEGIGHLVIGKNDGWKQEMSIGKRNNQNFVQVPHARFIAMLTYKAQLVGIAVHLTEESYTSKCSFLDNEPLEKQEHYAGRRIKRGLFRSAQGVRFNADVNGAYNILRKVAPHAYEQGSRGCAVHPVPLVIGA